MLGSPTPQSFPVSINEAMTDHAKCNASVMVAEAIWKEMTAIDRNSNRFRKSDLRPFSESQKNIARQTSLAGSSLVDIKYHLSEAKSSDLSPLLPNDSIEVRKNHILYCCFSLFPLWP